MTNFLINKFLKNKKYSNSKYRKRAGILSGIIGIICNLIMFVGKMFVGIISSSIAVSADAFNNLADVGSSIVTIVGFKIASSPANPKHPFGFGRVEYISGLIISVAIIITGLEFAKSSIDKIFNPEKLNFDFVSIIILILSLILKLWLGIFNTKLGEIMDSSALKATALDSISDMISTGAILLSMLVTYFTHINVDGYAGILVACIVIYTGLKVIRESINPLLGQVPDLELVQEINNIVLSDGNILKISELFVHDYGPEKIVISLRVDMPKLLDIVKQHEIIDTLEKNLKNKFDCQAIIHVDPI
ncbi:MAG: cation transporter [Candidatus Paraimprobicoccus trichonymphae]|uniref:Cation transporter n=1 Tax=Candidatus Paraimprobicoccus trichonymphae TaxID=3033793 RepID=A0AA48I6Q9_9FIRM|nr:MAG: cation transporter [Candidatus Paraimprobicoccus trichonymphae]